MNMTINEVRFEGRMRAISDGSVAGTVFFNEETGEKMIPADITLQQEGLSSVRIRFATRYGIGSFSMGPDDTLMVNAADGT
jgi:hypothetical protein